MKTLIIVNFSALICHFFYTGILNITPVGFMDWSLELLTLRNKPNCCFVSLTSFFWNVILQNCYFAITVCE